MPDATKILLSVPTRGNPSHTTVTRLEAIRDQHPGLSPILWEQSTHSVCDGRNRIVRKFKEGPWEWLVMVDDDMLSPMDILGLCDRPVDIVGAPCLICRYEANLPFPNVFQWRDDINGFYPIDRVFGRAGLTSCDAVGTGTMAIHRNVLEHPDLKPAFIHGWDANGELETTEDMLFCKRAGQAGFKIYADYDRFSDQHARVNLTNVATAYAFHIPNLQIKSNGVIRSTQTIIPVGVR